MTIEEVAKAFAALCAEGRHEEAGDRFWAEDVVSIEAADGEHARCDGVAAVRRKTAWWNENFTVHGGETFGPWINGDQFALRFTLDFTPNGGERAQMEEVALYTVRDGRVVEERFFY